MRPDLQYLRAGECYALDGGGTTETCPEDSVEIHECARPDRDLLRQRPDRSLDNYTYRFSVPEACTILRQEITELDELERLTEAGSHRPFVSAELVARLAAFDRPGRPESVAELLEVSKQGLEMRLSGKAEAVLKFPSGT